MSLDGEWECPAESTFDAAAVSSGQVIFDVGEFNITVVGWRDSADVACHCSSAGLLFPVQLAM